MLTCEIENCPCTATNISAYTCALQGALSLAFATTSTTFQSGSLWFSGDDVMDDFFCQIAGWRNIYEILAHGAKNYTVDGLNLAYTAAYIDEPKFKTAYDNHWWRITVDGADAFLYNGLPVLMSKQRVINGVGGAFVTEFSAPGIDRESLAKLLKNGLLLSGNAFMELAKRGLMDFTGVKTVNSQSSASGLVKYSDDALNGFAAGKVSNFNALQGSGVDFELRTTVVSPIHSTDSIRDMGKWLLSVTNGKPVPRLFVQPFVDRDTVPVGGLSAPTREELELFQEILTGCAEAVALRGT
jgi:hypothetical protein